jgi:putative PIN family toxin of toxin-antitoxin system
MPRINVFLDSSALIAGIISHQGAARALLLLGEDEKIVLTVSEQVITEVERNLARKVQLALPFAREIILHANIRILRDPPVEEVRKNINWTNHPADVAILVAANRAKVDFLATLDTRHFLSDPGVAQRSALKIGTPGDVLAWVRGELTK